VCGARVLTQQLALLKELTVRIHEVGKTFRLASRRCRRSRRQRRARSTGVRRGWLRRAVDLDDVAVGIEEVELGVPAGLLRRKKTRIRVVLRRVFALKSAVGFEPKVFTSAFANDGGLGCYQSWRRLGGHRAQRGKRARREISPRVPDRRVLKTVGNCRGLPVMRPTTLSISARKRPSKPVTSASYQSCASMSSARAASVKRTGHTTGNAVRVLP
jgi:hypothetical protein